jgi:hypothetical protein
MRRMCIEPDYGSRPVRSQQTAPASLKTMARVILIASYGACRNERLRTLGIYRILKGEHPSTLPVDHMSATALPTPARFRPPGPPMFDSPAIAS